MMRKRISSFDSVSDETLARQAQQGCMNSFAELVSRFQVPVLRYLQRRTLTSEDAEDLTQDLFVRAYTKLDRYRSEWSFATWIFTLARRLSINHHRRRRLQQQPMLPLPDSTTDPARVVADREGSAHLWDLAAAVLTEAQWSSLWLYYVQDLSTIEISRVLSCSPGAVKALLHRGRSKLGDQLRTTRSQPIGVRTSQAWIETLSEACRQLELEHDP